MESMEYIDLFKTAIKELPIAIENMNGLLSLTLSNCENLERFPSSICNLRLLYHLTISKCPKLDKLPEKLGNLKSSGYLEASRTTICQLPSSLTSLEKLTELECCRCRGLTLLPMLVSVANWGSCMCGHTSNQDKIFGVTIQDIGETSGRRRRSRTSNDHQEEVEPHPKRFCTRLLNLDLSL
ncbi:hypothetical protein EZV62_005625 [Acer yangbiense]|uniref:Disease resistance R13L4/SHOC-2-like LRR domain-containing protein n=1 Tax=Acer yangbiense TaxID=1000413 RepID=A0A5C7IN87_9ROSI|nr:hypothetical protein EZV62_005625 [Acer yangbiense]